MAKPKATGKASTHKSCQEMTQLVLDYLSESQPPAVKKDFERHLSICPDCVSFLRTYRKTVSATRAVKAEQLPAQVRENILAFLRKQMRRIAAFLFLVTHLSA